jgi:NAD(P)-dependent dehydrogenase (short-subunit alcohol dehydrogenase family)
VKEPVDVLINNAGIYGSRSDSSREVDLGTFAEVLAVNTIAPIRVARAFLPQLRQSTTPRILTISSQMGALSGSASGSIAYRTSKAAVNKAMQVVASDLRADGIAVAVAHPGWVQTDMGGGGADITAQESARGLVALIDRLTLTDTGQFFRWDGTTHPW